MKMILCFLSIVCWIFSSAIFAACDGKAVKIDNSTDYSIEVSAKAYTANVSDYSTYGLPTSFSKKVAAGDTTTLFTLAGPGTKDTKKTEYKFTFTRGDDSSKTCTVTSTYSVNRFNNCSVHNSGTVNTKCFDGAYFTVLNFSNITYQFTTPSGGSVADLTPAGLKFGFIRD